MGRSFEDVEFGEDLPEVTPDVSMPRVLAFTETAAMSFSRFTNHEAAKKEGLPGAIVPGIMSQGILAAVIHAWAPDAEVLKLDTTFRQPVIVDSKPLCRGVVTDMNDEARTVEIDLTIANETGETRVVGTATVKL